MVKGSSLRQNSVFKSQSLAIVGLKSRGRLIKLVAGLSIAELLILVFLIPKTELLSNGPGYQ